MENIIMELIVHSGEARSYSMEAMALAKKGEIVEARNLMEKANEELLNAHNSQTKLIQDEAGGNKTEMSLLLVHAQDHLMTSITLKDLSLEIIDIHEKLKKIS